MKFGPQPLQTAAPTPMHTTLNARRRRNSLVHVYSDALQSIFQFASLQEWARWMSVSGQWRYAVMSMPPIAVAAILLDKQTQNEDGTQLTCLLGS